MLLEKRFTMTVKDYEWKTGYCDILKGALLA